MTNKETKKVNTNLGSLISALEAQKVLIDNALPHLRALQGMEFGMPAGIPDASVKGHHRHTEIDSDTFHRMSFIEAVIAYLDMIGKKQTTDEIIKAVTKGGIKITETSAGTLLRRAAKKRTSKIDRVGRGEWGLTAWYNK